MSANPRTAYARGAAFEREVKKVFESFEWVVTRSPRSGGVYDLHATGHVMGLPVVLFIQCKKAGECRPAQWNALYELAQREDAYAVIAARRPREPLKLWVITGPKTATTRRNPWVEWELG